MQQDTFIPRSELVQQQMAFEREFEEFRTQTEEYEEHLELQVQEKEASLTRLKEEFEELLREHNCLKQKYTKNEAEVSALQTARETLQDQLNAFLSQKRELEQLNDHWEQSARILEYSKQDLEDKLYQAEESAIMYKEELNEITDQRAEEVERLHEQIQEISSELTSLNALANNPLRIKEIERDLANVVSQQQLRERKNNVELVVQVRPGEPSALSAHGDTLLLQLPRERGRTQKKEFCFDRVCVGQDDLLSSVKGLVEQVAAGGRACVVAYGQTGSGKTHAISSVFKKTLNALSVQVAQPEKLRVSCIEIYNEMARDLLCPGKFSKNWREIASHSKEVKDWAELSGTVAPVLAQRSEAKKVNEKSHFICSIQVNSAELQLADLAGSERASKTETGDSLKETLLINKSLAALQEVVAAIECKNKHVPYRSSVLTQALQPTLNYRAAITVILNCSPQETNLQETLCTLALGNRLKAIDFAGKQHPTNQQIERTFSLLQRERAEKLSLSRKTEQLERDLGSYKAAIKDRDSKSSKRERELLETIEKLRREVASSKLQSAQTSKKLNIFKSHIDAEKQAKTKALLQLKLNEKLLKRATSQSSTSSRRLPSAPPSAVLQVPLTPSRIPRPRPLCNLPLPNE